MHELFWRVQTQCRQRLFNKYKRNFLFTVRFENEELEVKKFVGFMKEQRPDAFNEFEGTTLEEILITLKETTVLWSKNDDTGCDCKCDSTNNVISRAKRDNMFSKHVPPMQHEGRSDSETTIENKGTMDYQTLNKLNHDTIAKYNRIVYNTISSKGFYLFDVFTNFLRIKNFYANSWQNSSQTDTHLVEPSPSSGVSFNNSLTRRLSRQRRAAISTNTYAKPYSDVFVFSVNNDQDNFHVVAKFKNLTDSQISMSQLEDKITKTAYYEDYKRIHVLSLGIKYAGFGILTLMLAEVGGDLAR